MRRGICDTDGGCTKRMKIWGGWGVMAKMRANAEVCHDGISVM
jgi:hypothetical protein